MPTFDTLRQDADERVLIRKVQKAVGFIAPTSVSLPASLFDGGGALIDLKAAGWLPIGMVTPDGWEFGRDVSSEDVTAFGYAGPVRSDTTEVARTVSVAALETGRRHMLELAYGTDLSAITQSGATGEVIFDEPDLPISKDYRLLIIGSDGPAADNWIIGRGYGLVTLDTTDSQTWGTSDPLSQSFSFKVFTDDAIGTPVKHYMGGTGAVKHRLITGFTQVPPAIPTITSVLPSGATTGQQVTIKGTGFVGATAVAFGAVNAPTFTVVDSTTIVVTVPSSTAGTVLVTVTNTTGASAGFSYTRGA